MVVSREGLEVVGEADQEEVVLPGGDSELGEVRGGGQAAELGGGDAGEELLGLWRWGKKTACMQIAL